MRFGYQAVTFRKNQMRIIRFLSEQSLTFTELIEKCGLARATVHKHLKILCRDDLVEKVYKDGKILNVLNVQMVDMDELNSQIRMCQNELGDLEKLKKRAERAIWGGAGLKNRKKEYGRCLNTDLAEATVTIDMKTGKVID